MNRTNIEHAMYALLMQLPFGLAGWWWAGAAFAVAFFLGREHAQWEKHLVNGGAVNGLNPLAGFGFFKHGDLDSRLDFWLPAGCVVAAALLFGG